LGFRESLPNNCPPAEAHDRALEQVFRFVPTGTPVAADFASNAAKQEPLPPGVDPCRWASCSLCADMEQVEKARKFPKLKKFQHVAKMNIPKASGLSHGTKHIDFWMFDSFDPVGAVVEVRKL
jgi:hypothetical protein